MNRAQKDELAMSLKEKFSKAHVAIFADYKGLNSPQADELRRALRAQKAEVKVLKNNVARLVTRDGLLGNDAKVILDNTVGPTLVAFSFGDPAATAKVMHRFAQDNEAFALKDSLMGHRRIGVLEVEELAKLPSKEILVAKMLGTMNAPVTNFVSVLAAVPRSLVTVLSAIERKKTGFQG